MESIQIATILLAPFCQHHFVQYHFVRSPMSDIASLQGLELIMLARIEAGWIKGIPVKGKRHQ